MPVPPREERNAQRYLEVVAAGRYSPNEMQMFTPDMQHEFNEMQKLRSQHPENYIEKDNALWFYVFDVNVTEHSLIIRVDADAPVANDRFLKAVRHIYERFENDTNTFLNLKIMRE